MKSSIKEIEGKAALMREKLANIETEARAARLEICDLLQNHETFDKSTLEEALKSIRASLSLIISEVE